MRVIKFGGTSLASAERILHAASLTRRSLEEDRTVVVVSALARVTDLLERSIDSAARGEAWWRQAVSELAVRHLRTLEELGCRDGTPRDTLRARLRELARLLQGAWLLRDCPAATRDRILATGERLSVILFAAALGASEIPADTVDGSEVIATDDGFGAAPVHHEATRERSRARLAALPREQVAVVTGFIGAAPDGRTTTLGRGGSDLSASVLGAALDAQRVEIWTDVPGVLSAPPRQVRGACTLPRLSYEEAAELSFFGAAVLCHRTVAPLARRAIPIVVRSTLSPEGRHTLVSRQPSRPVGACAVAAIADAGLLTLSGESALAALDQLADKVPQPLLVCRASAGGAWTLAAPGASLEAFTAHLATTPHGPSVKSEGAVSVIAVVGHRVLAQPWVAGRALEALGRHGLAVRGVVGGATPHAVCLLVEPDRLGAALEIIHDALRLDRQGELAPCPTEKGGEHDVTQAQGCRPRRDRERGAEAGPPAA